MDTPALVPRSEIQSDNRPLGRMVFLGILTGFQLKMSNILNQRLKQRCII